MFHYKARSGKDIDVIPNNGQFEIEVEKTMHLKNIYKVIYEWLIEHEYHDAENDGGSKIESLYFEIKKANGLMFHHIWWRVLKKPRGSAKSNNVRYFMKINFQTLGMSKIETMLNNKKFKTYKGDLIIRMRGYLQIDHADTWNDHWLVKYFQPVLLKRWLKKDIETEKAALYADMVALQRHIKQFLGVKVEVPTVKEWKDELTGI